MTECARVAGLVLAAGFSRRLGRPKQTVVLAGETLLERAVRVAQEAGLDPVIATVNPELAADPRLGRAGLEASGCKVLVNPNAAEGMASSITCGISALQDRWVAGVVLMTCDQMALKPEHLRALYAKPDEPAGSGYSGRVGVPAYFPQSCFEQLQSLQGDEGARKLLSGVRVVQAEELALDVDTAGDLRRAEEWLRTHAA